jgi:sec-independent protein translocase protein TatB
VFNLDPAKLFVILVVALIVLGPERLPKVARQLGAAWRELTRVRDQITDEVRSALPDSDVLPSLKVPYRSGTISNFIRSASTASTNGAVAEGPNAEEGGDLQGPALPPRARQEPELLVPFDDPSLN